MILNFSGPLSCPESLPAAGTISRKLSAVTLITFSSSCSPTVGLTFEGHEEKKKRKKENIFSLALSLYSLFSSTNQLVL